MNALLRMVSLGGWAAMVFWGCGGSAEISSSRKASDERLILEKKEAETAQCEDEAAETEGERWIREYFAEQIASCGDGDNTSCSRLAARSHFATNDKELERISSAMQSACKNSAVTACGWLGRRASTPDKGEAQIASACEKDDSYSCAILGEIRLKAAQTDEEKEAVRQFLNQKCETIGGWPCFTAATIIWTEGTTGDKELAQALMKKACDDGDPIACYELGLILAENETQQNAQEITDLYSKGCEADFGHACYNYAWRYWDGRGAPQDREQGMTLAQKACHLGDSAACDFLAGELNDSNPESFCAFWGAKTCYEAAAILAQKSGEVAETARALVRYADTACRRGSLAGCNVLGHVARDAVKTCDGGEETRNSCAFVGYIYAQGVKLPRLSGASYPKDPKKAAEYLRRSCNAGYEQACHDAECLGNQKL